MRKIFKYPLEVTGQQVFDVPESAVPRSVGQDPDGVLCMWCEVSDHPLHGSIENQDRKNLWVYIVGTGHDIPVQATKYVGTVKDGEFMWHIYTNE